MMADPGPAAVDKFSPTMTGGLLIAQAPELLVCGLATPGGRLVG
jgi:hypothetical protein